MLAIYGIDHLLLRAGRLLETGILREKSRYARILFSMIKEIA